MLGQRRLWFVAVEIGGRVAKGHFLDSGLFFSGWGLDWGWMGVFFGKKGVHRF